MGERVAETAESIRVKSGRFEPTGFIHAGCARAYLDTTDVIARVRRFSPGLDDEALGELRGELETSKD